MLYAFIVNYDGTVPFSFIRAIIYPLPSPGPVFSYKLRCIVGFWLVEMAISTNQKPAIYRNLYENTAPVSHSLLQTQLSKQNSFHILSTS